MREKIADRVLAEGEVTGHAHRLTKSDVYEVDGVREFDAPDGDTITHEEHGAQELPPGDYASGIVREWDSFAEEAREVMD